MFFFGHEGILKVRKCSFISSSKSRQHRPSVSSEVKSSIFCNILTEIPTFTKRLKYRRQGFQHFRNNSIHQIHSGILGNGNRLLLLLFESEVSGVSGEFGDILVRGLIGVSAELLEDCLLKLGREFTRVLEDCLLNFGIEFIRSRYACLFKQFVTLIHKCK